MSIINHGYRAILNFKINLSIESKVYIRTRVEMFLKGHYLFLLLLLFICQSIASQAPHASYDNYRGNWETPESWSPTWDAPITDNILSQITIFGYITCNSPLDFVDGGLMVHDTLVIHGDLDMGIKTSIVLNDHAILMVLGSIFIEDPAQAVMVGNDAYLIVSGSIMVQGATNKASFRGNDVQPKIFIGGDVQPSSLTADDNNYAALNCFDPLLPYPNSKCTYGDFVDLESDPIFGFYQSLTNGSSAQITSEPSDVTTCENKDVEYIIEAVNFQTLQWQVNDGDGYINLVNDENISGSNSSVLSIKNVSYLNDGFLYRCKLTGSDASTVYSNPSLLTVLQAVSANAGSDATICENSAYTVDDASVNFGNGTYSWTHNGNGTLSNATTLTPTYTASHLDAGFSVILTLMADGNADCAQAVDQMNITVDKQVTANAGSDATICENSAYTVNDASVNYGNGTYSWTHNGTGTLSNATTLTPTYTASNLDAGFTVILTLMADGNADCVQAVDQMNIVVEKQVAANAGSDATICENSAYTIDDASVNFGNGTYSWTHNGKGTLSNATTLTPTYTASNLDAGFSVILTLTADGNADCEQAVDQMNIAVDKQVTANAGNDATICENSAYTVDDASVNYGNGTYNWTHNGDGTLSNATTLTPTYTASNLDAGFTVILTLTADGNVDCAQAVDQMNIVVEKQVTANAGSDATICENSAYTVDDASVNYGNRTYSWTHNGNGTLSNATTLIPTYTASNLDAGFSVILTLTADGNADCAQAVDQMNIAVDKQVTANAGNDATICENSAYTVNDASVNFGNGTYSWTHNGNGTLSNATTLTPTYTASNLDAGFTVILTLTADGNADCAQAVDQMNIAVDKQVTANAGSDATICENSAYTVNDASVNYGNGTYSWTHNGNGTLSNAATLTPNYTASNLDAGFTVILTLTADGNVDCAQAVDQMNIVVEKQVTANAGSDASICENSAYTVNDASASFGNGTYSWTHNGNGTLSNATTLIPTYTASNLDAGSTVILALTADGNADCAQAVDQMNIVVEKQVTANAGSDAAICENSIYKVNDASVNFGNGAYIWTHNGQGTLYNATSLTPTYSASNQDAGSTVILTLMAAGNADCAQAVDQMNIEVEKQVTAHAGIDTTICESGTYTVTDANVSYGNGTYNWSHNGNGSLTNETILTPTYTADVSDAGQVVTLTLSADGNADCGQSEDQMEITVANQVVANAGIDTTICESGTYTVSDANVSYGNGTYSWTHNGNGILSNATTLTPTYTASNLDAGFTVILTLTADGNADCAQAADQMNIAVEKQVTAHAGSDAAICENSAYTVNDASVSFGNGTLDWTHNGNGTLSNVSTLTPTYTASNLDAGNIVVLTFTADGNADCAQAAVQMIIAVEKQVTAYAGSDAAICENSAYTVNDASVSFGNGILVWTHNGNGTLNNASTLTPTYTASNLDAGNTVILTLMAEGKTDCAQAEDQMNIVVEKQVTANAGLDDVICGTSYALNATLNGGEGIWKQNSGPGIAVFSNENYLPNVEVQVPSPGLYSFIWMETFGACSDQATINVTFKEIPIVDIGADDGVCGLEYEIDAVQSIGDGYWQMISGPKGASFENDINQPTNIITVDEPGICEVAWIASNDGCQDSSSVKINFNEIPKVSAGSHQELYFSSSTVLQASLQENETGWWDHVKGYGILVDYQSPVSEITNLEIGDHILVWNVENGECINRSEVLIKVEGGKTPTIITPNGDGVNDVFIIKGNERLGAAKLIVFNRWGHKVYQNNDYKNDWSGRDMHGDELQQDTYYYYLELGNKKVIKSYVLIQK